MRTVPENRLRELLPTDLGIPEIGPGTPDNEVSMIRLAAREAFRSGQRFVASRGYLFGRGAKPS